MILLLRRFFVHVCEIPRVLEAETDKEPPLDVLLKEGATTLP